MRDLLKESGISESTIRAVEAPSVRAAVHRAIENVWKHQDEPPPEPNRGSIWEHYKGSWYQVLHLARHTETGETLVVYRTFKEDDGQVWVRPLSMWHDTVGDRRRFTLILG